MKENAPSGNCGIISAINPYSCKAISSLRRFRCGLFDGKYSAPRIATLTNRNLFSSTLFLGSLDGTKVYPLRSCRPTTNLRNGLSNRDRPSNNISRFEGFVRLWWACSWFLPIVSTLLPI